MDLLVYTLILVAVGFIKMNKKSVSLPTPSGGTNIEMGTTVDVDIPIGNNLRLMREPEAYTLILQQFGLMR